MYFIYHKCISHFFYIYSSPKYSIHYSCGTLKMAVNSLPLFSSRSGIYLASFASGLAPWLLWWIECHESDAVQILKLGLQRSAVSAFMFLEYSKRSQLLCTLLAGQLPWLEGEAIWRAKLPVECSYIEAIWNIPVTSELRAEYTSWVIPVDSMYSRRTALLSPNKIITDLQNYEQIKLLFCFVVCSDALSLRNK